MRHPLRTLAVKAIGAELGRQAVLGRPGVCGYPDGPIVVLKECCDTVFKTKLTALKARWTWGTKLASHQALSPRKVRQ